MKKRLICFALVIVLALGLFVLNTTAEDVTETFSGKRSVLLKVDVSDLENFYIGGRQALDLAIRQGRFEWLEYSMYTDTRDVCISLSFAFSSMADYMSKLQSLLQYTPGVYYEADKNTVLMESFSATELLNFVKSIYSEEISSPEKTLDSLLIVSQNSIEFDSNTYEDEDEHLSVTPDGFTVTKADKLSIVTVPLTKGGYTRTIEVGVSKQNDEDNRTELFQTQFSKVGSPTVDGDTITVSFSALSDAELIQKTVACLHVVNSITEKESYVDEKTVGVTRSETIDVDSLLNEGANFTYSFEYPAIYSNLKIENESITIEGNTISAYNQSMVTFTYERGFRFSKIENNTDLTNVFGKMKKTIRFYAPIGIAAEFHEQIKAELSSRLVKGTTFNVYDVDGMRCFEFCFEAWYQEQIQEFNRAVLGSDLNDFSLQRGFFPWAKNTVKESVDVKKAFKGMVMPEKTISTYTFVGGTEFQGLSVDDDVVSEGGVVTFFEAQNIDFAFVGFNFFISLIYFGFLIVLVVLVIVTVKIVKFIKKKIKEKPKKEKAEKVKKVKTPKVKAPKQEKPKMIKPMPAGRVVVKKTPVQETPKQAVATQDMPKAEVPKPTHLFCVNCGAKMPSESKFCENCGTKIE